MGCRDPRHHHDPVFSLSGSTRCRQSLDDWLRHTMPPVDFSLILAEAHPLPAPSLFSVRVCLCAFVYNSAFVFASIFMFMSWLVCFCIRLLSVSIFEWKSVFMFAFMSTFLSVSVSVSVSMSFFVSVFLLVSVSL